MQKRNNNMRWSNKDKERLSQTVGKFNAKITRLNKEYPVSGENFLPEKTKVSDIKNRIVTRADFNREMNKLERIFKENATDIIENDYGVKTLKYTLNEAKIETAIINRQRTIERKRVLNTQAKSAGKDLDLKRGEMGDQRINELKPKKMDFKKIKSVDEWWAMLESIEKQSAPRYNLEKMQRFKENYIKGLRNNFVNGQADKLIKILEKIDARTFVDTFYADEQATIDFYYYDPINEDTKIDILEELWSNVAEVGD